MLIKYEYELLSSIVENGVAKVNGDILVSFNRIEDELKDEKFNEYLQSLEINNIIECKGNNINILVENWLNFFIKELTHTFNINNMDVLCKNKISTEGTIKKFYIEFIINGTSKSFEIVFDNYKYTDLKQDDLIFMCIPNIYKRGIYWVDLINNVNLLNQFYLYLINESIHINKNAYRAINIFEGIDEKYISEIFNVSIKKYFLKKKHEVSDFIKDECDIIERLFSKDDLIYYGVKFETCRLWLIKKNKIIICITIKDNQLVYSKEIEKEIDNLQQKLIDKLSEFKSISLYKENNVLDSELKTIGKISTICVPGSIIINLLVYLNSNLLTLLQCKNILILVMIVLGVIQFYLLKFIGWPILKLSKFTWKIK